MRRFLPLLRATAAACLVFAGSAVQAAPATPADEALSALRAAYERAVAPGEQADLHRDLFGTVLGRLERSHALDVDLRDFAAAGVKAMESLPAGTGDAAEVFKKAVNDALRTLDPYSRYLDARAHGNDRSDSSGSFGGLGLEIETRDGMVRVIAPMPGGPAARGGLQAGDLIVRIDDQPLAGVPLSDAVSKMRGQPGTPVTVTIRRASVEQEFNVSLTRDTIRRQALNWRMEGDVLVLRLAGFTSGVSAQVAQAVEQASAVRPPAAVVLDLRGNPGGLLREAMLLADLFLSKGDIVSLSSRGQGAPRTRSADPAEVLPGTPMLVLLDRRSASASELVAAALQENGRAKVMGQRSFGKGTVQTTYPLGEQRGALKVTTSYYLGPLGRSVNRVGVTPDLELVTDTPDTRAHPENTGAPMALDAAMRAPQARLEQARCASLGAATDPALACAVAYLLAQNPDEFLAVTASSSAGR